MAAVSYDASVMRALVAGGADPLLATDENVTPLMVAAGLTRWRTAGAPLTEEDETRALEAVKLAVELGADLNATEKRTGNARVWIHLLNIIETPFNSGTDSISVIVFRPLRYDQNSIDARRGTQLLGLVHSREIVFEGGLAHRRE